jgi:hypothetical protein
MTLFHGEYLSGEFTLKFSASRDADTWTVLVTDRWLNRYEEETNAASPYGLLDQLIERAIRGCHAQSAAQRPPRELRPALQTYTIPKTAHTSVLGPKRASKTETIKPAEEVTSG